MCAWLLFAGCPGKIEERQMGEAIEMGPFVFEVEATGEEFQQSDKVIVVHLWLDTEKSGPFRKTFGDSLFGRMHIVDGAGNKFDDSSMGPVSGSMMSAAEWRVMFVLRPNAGGIRDRNNLGDRPSDFRLVIKNPDRRGDQPGRVSIPLR